MPHVSEEAAKNVIPSYVVCNMMMEAVPMKPNLLDEFREYPSYYFFVIYLKANPGSLIVFKGFQP